MHMRQRSANRSIDPLTSLLTEKPDPFPCPPTHPPTPQPKQHGFRSVPRALLVERVGKDKERAHKLGDKVMKSMGAGQQDGDGAGGSGGGGGQSALQR